MSYFQNTIKAKILLEKNMEKIVFLLTKMHFSVIL